MTTPGPNPFVTAGTAGSPIKIADLENCLAVFRPRAVDTYPTKDYGPKRATACAVHVIYSPGGLPDPAAPSAAPRQATADAPINYPELLIFNGPIQGQFRAHLNVDGTNMILGWIVKGAPIKSGQQAPWVLNCELSPEAAELGARWHATFGASLPPLPPVPTPQPLPAAPGGPVGYAPPPQAPYGYPQAGYPQQPAAAAPYGYPQQQPAAPQPQYAPQYAQTPAPAPVPAPQPQYAPAPQYAAPAAVPQPQYAPAPAAAPQYAPAPAAPAPAPVPVAAGVPAPPF